MSLTDRNFEQYWNEHFEQTADDYENGNRDAADVWAQFKSEIDIMETAIKNRKDWGNENRESIISEFDKYGKDGFKGYTATTHKTVKYHYDHIPEWKAHKDTMTEIEEWAKNAVKLVGSGGELADTETGVVMPAAKVTESYSLKTSKIK